MTFGQSLGFALIWQKLRGIEKNTKGAMPAKPQTHLAERSAEGVPDAFITAFVCVLFVLVIAFIVCLIFAKFTPAIICGISFAAIIRLACFKRTQDQPE